MDYQILTTKLVQEGATPQLLNEATEKRNEILGEIKHIKTLATMTSLSQTHGKDLLHLTLKLERLAGYVSAAITMDEVQQSKAWRP